MSLDCVVPPNKVNIWFSISSAHFRAQTLSQSLAGLFKGVRDWFGSFLKLQCEAELINQKEYCIIVLNVL